MAKRRLPIGMQTFRTLREQDCYYVDKTAYIERLLDEGTHYFLSRPRRFGKSLFLDTLKELFEGSQALFAGLHIHDRYDWSVHHPVVRLSFGGGSFTEPGLLEANVMEVRPECPCRARRFLQPARSHVHKRDRRQSHAHGFTGRRRHRLSVRLRRLPGVLRR